MLYSWFRSSVLPASPSPIPHSSLLCDFDTIDLSNFFNIRIYYTIFIIESIFEPFFIISFSLLLPLLWLLLPLPMLCRTPFLLLRRSRRSFCIPWLLNSGSHSWTLSPLSIVLFARCSTSFLLFFIISNGAACWSYNEMCNIIWLNKLKTFWRPSRAPSRELPPWMRKNGSNGSLIFKFLDFFFLLSFPDGDENKKDIRGWSVGPHNAGRCEELLWAIWAGKYNARKASAIYFVYFIGIVKKKEPFSFCKSETIDIRVSKNGKHVK